MLLRVSDQVLFVVFNSGGQTFNPDWMIIFHLCMRETTACCGRLPHVASELFEHSSLLFEECDFFLSTHDV